jgi:hypothetical protein
MEKIMMIKGKVKFSITLDPSVWIFDDRKIDLDTFFENSTEKHQDIEEYTKAISKHWDREIMEGAIVPPTLKTEKKYLKEKLLTGTFGMHFQPFLQNALPDDSAQKMIIESKDGEYSLTIQEAKEIILGFSKVGKPLTEDGPVYIYFGDGSNKNNPIKNVTGFRVE